MKGMRCLCMSEKYSLASFEVLVPKPAHTHTHTHKMIVDCYTCHISLENYESCDSIDISHFKIDLQQQVQ